MTVQKSDSETIIPNYYVSRYFPYSRKTKPVHRQTYSNSLILYYDGSLVH